MRRVPVTQHAPLANDRVSEFAGERRYLATGSVNDDGMLAPELVTYESRPSRADLSVRLGDVCFARMQATRKVLSIDEAGAEMILSTGFAVLRPDPEYLYSAYLRNWVASDAFQFTKDRLCTGATQKAITNAKIATLPIPLPPLAEQRQIAGILDAAEALRAKRREALAQVDTLTPSIFLEMFGDPVTNPMKWEQCVVGDVVHSVRDGPHVSPAYAESGVPFLSTRHIKPGEMLWEDLKYIDQDEASRQWKKCKPEFGDILYTKGGTTGVAARVTTAEPFAVWVHVALLKPIVKKVDPIWMEAMLNSAYCYTQSQRYTHGIANRDLGL